MEGPPALFHDLVDSVSRVERSSVGHSISLGPQGSHCLAILLFLYQIGTLTCLELRSIEPSSLCVGGEI